METIKNNFMEQVIKRCCRNLNYCGFVDPLGHLLFMDSTVYLKQNALMYTHLLCLFDHKNAWLHLQATTIIMY